MDERQHEYHRFGPWAIEVTDEDPAPPLFRPYLTRSEPALLSIKIPRHVERRNARPGMDLYDYLVCLYEDGLVVMQRAGQQRGDRRRAGQERSGDEVRVETVRYQDVQYVAVGQDLLRGNVHLGLPDRPFDLPYNTVSGDLMWRAVHLIRQRSARPEAHTIASREPRAVPDAGRETITGPDPQVGEDILSFYFDRLLADERRRSPDQRLLAAQATKAVADGDVHPVRRLLFSIASKRLLESMHLTDGHELKIIDRGAIYAYRWQAIYGVRTTFVPLANLRGVRWHEDEAHATTMLDLATSGGSIEQVFGRDNPMLERYAAFLSAYAGNPSSPIGTTSATTTASPAQPSRA
jgi:hypothetical protein